MQEDREIVHSSDEMLQYLVEHGCIDFDTVKKDMENEKRERILQNHNCPISLGSDGRWKTYVLDESKKTGRRLIAKTKKEDLEQAVIEFYTGEKNDIKSVTLESLYPKWINYKKKVSTRDTNVPRIISDWKRYYVGSSIIKVPLKRLRKIELEEWLISTIKENDMTKRQYYNFSLIIRQMLNYAVDSAWLTKNIMDNIKPDAKLFKREKKKQSSTQVYTKSEQKELEKLALCDFKTNTRRIKYPLVPLAVLFSFQTGLRVGELCAIKYGDIENDKLHVQRMYQRDTKLVIEHTKTEDGDRKIILTDKAMQIIERAKEYQVTHEFDSSGYIFSIDNSPLSAHAVNDALRKYCKKLGIMPKSSHKVRKTYISTLIDGGVNINTIREMAGHADERTTYNCYCFDRSSEDDIVEAVRSALN